MKNKRFHWPATFYLASHRNGTLVFFQGLKKVSALDLHYQPKRQVLINQMIHKKPKKRPVSCWQTTTWRKLLAILISIAMLIIPRSLEVQWSKDQTAVTIQR
jgi:hypothetical protein